MIDLMSSRKGNSRRQCIFKSWNQCKQVGGELIACDVDETIAVFRCRGVLVWPGKSAQVLPCLACPSHPSSPRRHILPSPTLLLLSILGSLHSPSIDDVSPPVRPRQITALSRFVLLNNGSLRTLARPTPCREATVPPTAMATELATEGLVAD